MSTFEREGFQWRETYFIFFSAQRRPKLKQIERALKNLSGRFELSGGSAADADAFESLTLLSPDDHAAIDISYVAGEEVAEQVAMLKREIKSSALDADEKQKLARLPTLDAKLDLLHFAEVSDGEDDPLDEMLDPSALLLVMESLVQLTGGVGVDPQSGSLI